VGTLEENPLLASYPYAVNRYSRSEVYSPRGDRLLLPRREEISVVSRRELAMHLMHQAQAVGATFHRERALRIARVPAGWTITTERGIHGADVVVGADGATSLVRQCVLARIPAQHLSVCCGYFLSGVPLDRGLVGFLDFEGYLWVVSCTSHASAGAITRWGCSSPRDLFRSLDGFLAHHLPGTTILHKWRAVVPTPYDPEFYSLPACGDDWLLVGDAAGHVDPMLAEGIYFAFRSARLACESLLADDPRSYDSRWRAAYGAGLRAKAQQKQSLLALLGSDPELAAWLLFRYFTADGQAPPDS
jgi:flavin-dependent dehydrogenase